VVSPLILKSTLLLTACKTAPWHCHVEPPNLKILGMLVLNFVGSYFFTLQVVDAYYVYGELKMETAIEHITTNV